MRPGAGACAVAQLHTLPGYQACPLALTQAGLKFHAHICNTQCVLVHACYIYAAHHLQSSCSQLPATDSCNKPRPGQHSNRLQIWAAELKTPFALHLCMLCTRRVSTIAVIESVCTAHPRSVDLAFIHTRTGSLLPASWFIGDPEGCV